MSVAGSIGHLLNHQQAAPRSVAMGHFTPYSPRFQALASDRGTGGEWSWLGVGMPGSKTVCGDEWFAIEARELPVLLSHSTSLENAAKIFLPTGRSTAKLIAVPHPWLGWAGPSQDDFSNGGTMAVLLSNPPEQGQMFSVRSRNWMVTDVSRSTLPLERLQAGLESLQHLLTLSSVEDDGLGEELNVIWELEPALRSEIEE
jgi:hypothetical protein